MADNVSIGSNVKFKIRMHCVVLYVQNLGLLTATVLLMQMCILSTSIDLLMDICCLSLSKRLNKLLITNHFYTERESAGYG